MSSRSNGLFWLERVVQVAHGRTAEACVLVWRRAAAAWSQTNERNGEMGAAGAHIHPRIKNAEGKGETIRAKSNNSRLQIPSIRFKDTNHAGSLHNSARERRRREQPEEAL